MAQSRQSLAYNFLIKLLVRTIQTASAEAKVSEKDHKSEEGEFEATGSQILDAICLATTLSENSYFYTLREYFLERDIVNFFKELIRKNILKDVFKYIVFSDEDTQRIYSIFDLFLVRADNLLNEDILKTIDILKNHGVLLPIKKMQAYQIQRSDAEKFLQNPIKFFYFLQTFPFFINKQDEYQETLLHYFAKEKYHENLKIILHLLFYQTNPSIDLSLKDSHGNTGIHRFLLSYLQKTIDNEDQLEKHQEILNFLIESAAKKKFDFSIKNKAGISVKQLIFVYRVKFLFDIDYVRKVVEKNDGTILTKALFSIRLLNPIAILKDYNEVIAEKIQYPNLYVEIQKLILALGEINKSRVLLENPSPFFYSSTEFDAQLQNFQTLKRIR